MCNLKQLAKEQVDEASIGKDYITYIMMLLFQELKLDARIE